MIYFIKILNSFFMMFLILAFQVFAQILPDSYEDDNHYTSANIIHISSQDSQLHNFHEDTDQDWVKFYGLQSVKYSISVINPGVNCDPAIALYVLDHNILTQVGEIQNIWQNGKSEEKVWICNKNSVYYVKVWTVFTLFSGEDVSYKLSVNDASAAGDGKITGLITDKYFGTPVEGVNVFTSTNRSAISDKFGIYRIFRCRQEMGISIYTKQSNYLDYTTSLNIYEYDITYKDLKIIPDIVTDHRTGLSDIIWMLKQASRTDSNNAPVKLSLIIELIELLCRR